MGWDYVYTRTYTVQWRPKNTTIWTTVEGLNTTSYSLTGLTTQTLYEWRVQGTCPGPATIVTDYSPIQLFTTVACPVPVVRQDSYTSSSVSVYWGSSVYGLNNTYTLRYRAVGATDWTRVEGLTATSYSVTGLTANTPYEVQVETACSATERSGFSASLMVTPTCLAPVYLFSSPKASSVQLSWNTPYNREIGTTFDLQYRPAGSSTWTTQTSLTAISTNANAIVSATSLAANTTYEWRVKTNCPGGVPSDYTAGSNFTTGCFPPAYLNVNGVSTTSASVGWTTNVEVGTRFDIRYRVARYRQLDNVQ